MALLLSMLVKIGKKGDINNFSEIRRSHVASISNNMYQCLYAWWNTSSCQHKCVFLITFIIFDGLYWNPLLWLLSLLYLLFLSSVECCQLLEIWTGKPMHNTPCKSPPRMEEERQVTVNDLRVVYCKRLPSFLPRTVPIL